MVIDYIINILIGYQQFMVVFSLFRFKDHKLKVLFSSAVLLSVYTVLYINLYHIFTHWVMSTLYIFLAALLFRFIHKVKFQTSITMTMIMVNISYIIEYILILLYEFVDYQIVYGAIYNDKVYFYSAKVVCIALWQGIYILTSMLNKREVTIFDVDKISTKQNLVLIAIHTLIHINLMILEDVSLVIEDKFKLLKITVIFFSLIYILATIYYYNVANTKNDELVAARMNNKALNEMLDQMRDFKHNLGNLLVSIHGMAQQQQYEELCEFTGNLRQDYSFIVNRDIVNYHFKDTTVLYGIIISKISFAELHNVQFDFNIHEAIKDYHIRSVDLARVIGVLLDNAFEAAINAPQRLVTFTTTREDGLLVFTIENTCAVAPDTHAIFDKGFTSKTGHNGIGLFEVKEIINQYRKANLNASVEISCENKLVTARLAI